MRFTSDWTTATRKCVKPATPWLSWSEPHPHLKCRMTAIAYRSDPQMSARLCAKQAHAAPQPHAWTEQRESAAERIDFRREIAMVVYGPAYTVGVEI